MKRMQAACILQTLVFSQKPDAGLTPEAALELDRQEVEACRIRLEKSGVRHQIVSVTEEADGSITLRVCKQLNSKVDVAEYFA